MGADDSDSTLSPDDAFAVLGNETRIAILQALWDAYDPLADDSAVKFSELYDRVGYGDTGNFNYHLSKLTDHFAHQADSGYELSEPGFAIVRAVIAGTIGERPRIDPTTIGVECPRCDGPVEVVYEEQMLGAYCTECAGLWQRLDDRDGLLFRFTFPPAGLADRTPEEAFHATVSYSLQKIQMFRSGVCPSCAGVVDETIDACDDHEYREGEGCPRCGRHHRIEAVDVCRQCKAATRGPLTAAILTHPTVTAFYHDHGIEHRFASWEAFRRAQTIEEEVVDADPLRVRLTIPCEGDRLRLTLDEDLSVVDVDR